MHLKDKKRQKYNNKKLFKCRKGKINKKIFPPKFLTNNKEAIIHNKEQKNKISLKRQTKKANNQKTNNWKKKLKILLIN